MMPRAILKLRDVCTFRNGGTPSRGVPHYFNGKIPWITGADITSPVVGSARTFITSDAITHSAANLVPAGTVLLVTRTSVGKVAIAGMDLSFSQDITALIPREDRVDAGYLVHFLRNAERDLVQRARGATIKGVSRDVVEGLRVPLPPLPEQRRIAAVLDRAEALRAKRREALAGLDQLTQAIFLDMFGDSNTDVSSWPIEQLASVVREGTIVTYGIVQAGEEFAGGVPYIRTGDIVDGEVIAAGLRHTDPSIAARYARSRVEAGDIVMSIRATVGTTAVVADGLAGANLTQGTARISPGPRTDTHFLLAYLRSSECQRWIQQQVKGATFREITLGRLRELPVLVPPFPLQREFTQLAAAVDRLKAAHCASLAEMDALFASLQHRAFRGEL